MCGYCIESEIILGFLVQQLKNDVQAEWYENPAYCLQEGEDFPQVIQKLKNFRIFPEDIPIAFSRIWERSLFQDHDDKSYQVVSSMTDDGSLNSFLSSIHDNCTNTVFESLADKQLYIDRNYWQRFISDKNELIAASLAVLNDYYHFWIAGNEREVSEQGAAVASTNDRNKFYSQFPLVCFSFLFIAKYQNESEIIKKIALQDPSSLPDLLAFDLWLQRRAFLLCVTTYGLQFVIDNYEYIRLELIYYSVIKKTYCTTDLQRLKKYIQANNRVSDGITTDDIIEIITYLKTII